MKENKCFFFLLPSVYILLSVYNVNTEAHACEWFKCRMDYFLSQLSSRTIKVIHVPLNSYNETEFRGPAYNHVIT